MRHLDDKVDSHESMAFAHTLGSGLRSKLRAATAAFLGSGYLRWLKLAMAVLLLAGLYTAADWHEVGQALIGLSPAYVAAALCFFVPQTLLSALRWQRLVAPICAISFSQSLRHTLGASALNLVTPSKLGDLSKAAMLPGVNPRGRTGALGRAAIEKGADVAALLVLMAAGFVATSLEATTATLAVAAIAMLIVLAGAKLLIAHPRFQAALWLCGSSLALWTLHLMQIDLFVRAAGVSVPWFTTLSRIPLSIFAGLLPISFCGLGTRDTALIWLFSDVAEPSTMAVVGMLMALRYLVPGAIGIPLLAGCWPSAGAKQVTVTRKSLSAAA